MAEEFTSYIVDNDKAFADALKKMGEATDDFRIPLTLIGKDFYKSEKLIFALNGPGLYQDLAPEPGKDGNPSTTSDYKEFKEDLLGFAYPILKGFTGRLMNSILSSSAPEAVYILTAQELILGTDVPYAIYHQSDRARRKLPKRKFIFITGGEKEVAQDSRITGRLERWLAIIDNYIKQVTEGEV